jgi:hypothetical protein
MRMLNLVVSLNVVRCTASPRTWSRWTTCRLSTALGSQRSPSPDSRGSSAIGTSPMAGLPLFALQPPGMATVDYDA